MCVSCLLVCVKFARDDDDDVDGDGYSVVTAIDVRKFQAVISTRKRMKAGAQLM